MSPDEPRSLNLIDIGPIDIGAMGPIRATETGTEPAGADPDQLALFIDKRRERTALEQAGQRGLFGSQERIKQ